MGPTPLYTALAMFCQYSGPSICYANYGYRVGVKQKLRFSGYTFG